jgi:hypothetical protein
MPTLISEESIFNLIVHLVGIQWLNQFSLYLHIKASLKEKTKD